MTGERAHAGWYFLALAGELTGEITPAEVAGRALMLVRGDDGAVRVFDARCPHRGAHLGYGGKRAGACVTCPFHGKRITLGGDSRLSVREYPALCAGEAVFARLTGDPRDDRGFAEAVQELRGRWTLVGAVTQPVRVPTDIVVENAFDVDHFVSVHLVPRVLGMHITPGRYGELGIEGAFETRPPAWQESPTGTFRSRFFARAFSPSVVITEIGPPGSAHVVVTGGTPTGTGCVARVAIGASAGSSGALEPLLAGARQAIAQDVAVWDHLDLSAPPQFDSRDRTVLAFRQFCAGFGDAA